MPIINTPLQRAQFYQLDLSGLRATVEDIKWHEVAGKNRLRHFFAAANWQSNIVSIGVSSSGAKGGAFFLDVQQPNGGPIIAQYVVKGSTNPGRTIFAEYVLQEVGLAKIPKTLALEIDSSDPNSEGMVMLSLLSNDARWRTTANRHRFGEALGFLWDNTTNQPKVPYLVVQKLFGGDQLTAAATMFNDIERWFLNESLAFSFMDPRLSPYFTEQQAISLVEDLERHDFVRSFGYRSALSKLSQGFVRNGDFPAALPAALGREAEIKTMLNNIYDTYTALGLVPTEPPTFTNLFNYVQTQNSAAAQALLPSMHRLITNTVAPAIQTLTSVLSNEIKVRNMGRVLAADTLIGNADRLQGERGANWDNLFVVNKQNRGVNKVNYPIGVIDNDTIMQTFPHAAFQNPGAYLDRLLRGSVELDVPPGVTPAPSSDLRQLLTDFDSWFDHYFAESLVLNDANYQLVINQYTQAGFPPDPTQGNWPQVRAWIKDGFSSGLQRINNLDLEEMRTLHSSLVWNYGVDSNFDFLAFQIRYTYLTAAQVTRNNQQQFAFTINHNTVRQHLLDGLNGQRFGVIHPELQAALQFGATQNPALITNQEQTDILQLLAHLSIQDQTRLIPTINKVKPDPAKTNQRKRACISKILLRFLTDYRNELDQDAAKQFVNVSNSNPFALALNRVDQVSRSKINKLTLGTLPHKRRPNGLGQYAVVTLCGLDENIYWS